MPAEVGDELVDLVFQLIQAAVVPEHAVGDGDTGLGLRLGGEPSLGRGRLQTAGDGPLVPELRSGFDRHHQIEVGGKAGLDQQRGFEDDNTIGLRGQLGEPLADEGMDGPLQPSAGGGLGKDLSGQPWVIDAAIGVEKPGAKELGYGFCPLTTRSVELGHQPVGIDDPKAGLTQPAGNGRLTGREPPGEPHPVGAHAPGSDRP